MSSKFFSLKSVGLGLVFSMGLVTSDTLNTEIECTTLYSTKSDNSDGSTASITCPSDSIMTSCSVWGLDDEVKGSYIESNECIAINGGSPSGVWASARCCTNLHGNFYDVKSSDIDESESVASCSDTDILTGCSSYVVSMGSGRKGEYPGDTYLADDNKYNPYIQETGILIDFEDNVCIAQNSIDNNGVYSFARCINVDNGYKLECKAIWGSYELNSWSIAECPSYDETGYFVASCNAYSLKQGIYGGGRILHMDQDKCGALPSHKQEVGVWAVAVCCKEYQTDSWSNLMYLNI